MPKTFPKKFVALDIETTDLTPERGEIIELGAAKYENGKVIDKYQTMVNPGKPIPTIITSITGIKDKDVEDAPPLSTVSAGLKDFVGNSPIVGHNVRFDLNFLEAKKITFDSPIYDTWKLATIMMPGLPSHSLETLSSFLKLKHLESHRAYDDAQASAELFLLLIRKIYDLEIGLLEEIIDLLKKRNWDLEPIFAGVMRERSRKSKKDSLFSIRKKSVTFKEKKNKKMTNIAWDTAELEKLFKKEGALKKSLRSFELRPNQVEMVREVAGAFDKGKKLVIEAGPGIGKSLAYLIPAVYFAVSNKEKVVISTYTTNLQEQLFKKDLPVVQDLTPFNFKAALLEGRKRYVCLRRLNDIKKSKFLSERELTGVVKVMMWLPVTTEGLISEVSFTFEEKDMINRINADSHFCPGAKCPQYKQCYLYKARKRAKEADLVIINHALLVSDLLKEKLFDYYHLVIDEAHHLEKSFTEGLSYWLSAESIRDVLNQAWAGETKESILRKVAQKILLGKNKKTIEQTKQDIDKTKEKATLFFGLFGIFINKHIRELAYEGQITLSLDLDVREYDEFWKIEEGAKSLNKILDQLIDSFTKVADIARIAKKGRGTANLIKDIEGMKSELEEINEFIKEVIISPREDQIYWLEAGENYIQFKRAPLGVRDIIKKDLFSTLKTVILTSATISTKEDFSYFDSRLALEKFNKITIPSLYDYKKNALVYLPNDIPYPKHPNYNNKVAESIMLAAETLGGRTMALFTSYSAIRNIYKKLAVDLKDKGIEVLGQGVSGGRMKIIEKFRRNPRHVILGTSSFWEGVDIPGESLSCLIIAKLPFEVPSEPVFKARSEEYDNSFVDYALPQAVMRFKQGFGRLIRSKSDKGVVIVLDRRIETAEYGLKFLESLPEAGVEYGKTEDITKVLSDFFKSPKKK